jgi:hypothetical protein
MAAVSRILRQCWLGFENLDKIMLNMKICLEDPRSHCTPSKGFKTIEEYLNVEDNLLEENEGRIEANFDVVHCLSLNFLNGLTGLLKACVLIDLVFLGDLEKTIGCFHDEMGDLEMK